VNPRVASHQRRQHFDIVLEKQQQLPGSDSRSRIAGDGSAPAIYLERLQFKRSFVVL
jgi:hypothetical protein